MSDMKGSTPIESQTRHGQGRKSRRGNKKSYHTVKDQRAYQREYNDGLTINGAPTTLTELRMYKPSRRRLFISHQPAARLHA